MAKKTQKAAGEARGEIDDETGKTVLTNVQARAVCTQNGFKARLELETKIDALIEKHIKPVKDELKKIKKNTAADTGIDATDLNNQYRIFKRQEEAKAMEDEGDRDRILDNQREVFNALKIGEMLDFFVEAA
jgi:uncharacterized protein YktA (UPF0223 family)